MKCAAGVVLGSVLGLAGTACGEDGDGADAETAESGTEVGGDDGDASGGPSGPGTTDDASDPDDPGTGGGDETGEDIDPGSELVQYTPDQADWDTFASKPFEGGTNTAHDPDGVGWISAEAWAESEWDGTIYNPSQMSPEDFANALCPSVDRVRGIREVFYAHNPFADPENPTKAEIDEWHRIAINHVRALVGYTEDERQVHPDHCMFARSLWGDERKFTTMWDDEYPGENGSAAGPCQGSGNAHCGASFLPDAEDQAPYLPHDHDACAAGGGSEGVFSGPKSNIPWSIKWSRGFCNTLIAEGFWGGHVGPWFHREKFGFSFWDDDPANNDNNAVLRAKWTGNLMPSLYCDPAEPDCDPENTGPGSGK